MADQIVHDDQKPAPVSTEGAWDVGLKVEAAFREAVEAARRESLAQGKPVPVTLDDGTVEWLFPDGSRRRGPV